MKTDAQRIAHYNARAQSSLLDPTLAAVSALAQANFATYESDFYPKQLQLRVLLDGYGITTPTYAFYEAYHGEVYHVSKVASGGSAVAMVAILVAKYKAWMGVPAEVNLKEIANAIYGIIVP